MKTRRGFTIVEMLVVVVVIGVLLGLVVPAIWGALFASKARATKAKIEILMAALQSYQTAYGSYPPTSLQQLKGGYNHGANSGIESLVLCLSTAAKGEPFMTFKEKDLENFDGDSGANVTKSYIQSGQLFEFVDDWGQPLVYVNSRDYNKMSGLNAYKGLGADFTVVPAKSAKSGQFQNLQGVQIWSIGPDGVNQNGTGDDINNWD